MGGDTLSEFTGAGRSMGLLEREGYDLPVQQGEEKLRNKGTQRYMVEHIRPNHLLSREQVISYNITKLSETRSVPLRS